MSPTWEFPWLKTLVFPWKISILYFILQSNTHFIRKSLNKEEKKNKNKKQQYQFWRDYTTQVWPCSHQLADSWAMDCHQQRREYHLEIPMGVGTFNWEEMCQDWPVVTLTFKIIIIKEGEKQLRWWSLKVKRDSATLRKRFLFSSSSTNRMEG